MPAHRRARRIPLPAIAGAVAAATVGLVVSVPIALAQKDPAPPAPAATVTVPAAPQPPTMIVYDDDAERGVERCDVFRSFFAPDEATCTVMDIGVAPVPERARAGTQWWIDNRDGEVNPK